MASFALAEALAMTGDKRLEPAVRRAVDYSLRAQHPSTGGWRYRPGDLGDTSQLGWQLMSLWSAERAGIKVPPQTWTGAERFLAERSPRPRGRSGELSAGWPAQHADDRRGDVLPPIGRRGARRRTRSGWRPSEATAAILAMPPEPNRVNLYYWYYGTLALHHQQEATQRGGGRLAVVEHGAHAWCS